MSKKIFISASTFAEHGKESLNLLEQNGFEYFINPLGRRLVQEEIIKMGKDSEGAIAGLEPYDDYVIDHLPQLRCISRCGVGLDNIALSKAKQKGIAVFNTPSVVIQPVAELTIAMFFDLLRNLSFHTALLKSGKWQKVSGNLLSGAKVGILGLGRIGRRVVELLNRLEADLYGADMVIDDAWAKSNNLKVLPVRELLSVVDIISIHLSDNAADSFKLDREKISLMKRGAAVINTSRGKFIDENALYDALSSKYLSAAALDVFSKEPYRGKLFELDNVILTPHVGTLTRESRLAMEVEATKNLINFFRS
ncbi:MAG: phosphoglycerate dehydrogenase [Candidatus Omnitrophica bacterium]|nr:phosphoglycerate dehydrogenase [Candidatus Omnitrophota bacterium]MBU2044068.1 phosphoglycerate dehydrogenase [Candidatus Omnitrophota bacterium]MBU2251077.1 phosphoglycerate dehydrogenase [Candidatus Omnitrophota bacterium]